MEITRTELEIFNQRFERLLNTLKLLLTLKFFSPVEHDLECCVG